MIAAPRPLRALVEAVHDALDVVKLARTVRILSKRLELVTALADEQRARAEHADKERQLVADRLKIMDELCDRDIAEARRRQADAERQRDEAVAALDLRDAGAEIRRARAN